MGKQLLHIIILVFITLNTSGQDLVIQGRVLNSLNQTSVSFANIMFPEMGKGTASDEQGFFQINVPLTSDSIQIKISCIGYFPYNKKISTNSLALIPLRPKVQSIAEVSVIAEEKESLETTSVIKKAALQHIQPTSFADLLELIPGGMAQNTNMTKNQLITLREPVAVTNSNYYDYNSSFGTAFLIDGMPMSGDAELQNVTGFSTTQIYSPLFKVNTTGKGIDMRLITTDNIESVEIVRGIPSVRYGELTSGLVKIKRAYKATDWQGRVKANSGSKLIALGKGFALPKGQALNLNVDYTYYRPDPCNIKVNYGRITGSVRYKNDIKCKNGLWSLKINSDYTGSFDETRIDPEIDQQETDTYDNDYNKVSLSSVANWKSTKKSWLSEFEYSLSGSYEHTENKITKAVVGRTYPITTSQEEGEFYGEYLPSSYIANLEVDGKPVYLNTSIYALFTPFFLNIEHKFSLGADYRYEKNFGDGEVYDVTRPLYRDGTGRPRASKDIPSIQKLALFAEDNFSIKIGANKLEAQIGIRANSALNLSKEYTIHNKFYFDPRINLAFSLQKKELFGKDLFLTFTGGYGWLTKFPGLTHLYPNLLYIDEVELNYYSQNEDLRQVYYKTKIIDPTNYSLKPNRNSKIELGVRIKSGRYRLNINGYYEEMKKGFKSLSQIYSMKYKDYDTNTGPSSSELTAPPTVDMFEYEDKIMLGAYSMKGNGAHEQKIGIEYQFDLGRFEAIQSRISINGAWMKTKYDLSEPIYKTSSTVIDGENYPYYGYYIWNRGRQYEQFNTNIRFDTQIDALKLIFSTTFQNLWYTNRKYNYNDGMPEYYFDVSGNQYTYTEDDTDDPILRFLYDENNELYFKSTRVPYELEINFKVTKKIGNIMRLAFYVNRLIYFAPDYKNIYNATVKREAFPYWGMELNFNL